MVSSKSYAIDSYSGEDNGFLIGGGANPPPEWGGFGGGGGTAGETIWIFWKLHEIENILSAP